MAYFAYGPQEPPEFAIYRRDYYKRRRWRQAIEARIVMTDTGLTWLRRVQQIGY